MRQAARQHIGQLAGVEPGEVAPDGAPELGAEPRVTEGVLDHSVTRRRHLERLAEQVAEDQHLDATTAQRLGERVVLGLGSLDPGDAVEEQVR